MNSSSQAYVGTAKRTFGQALVHLLENNYRILGSSGVLELIQEAYGKSFEAGAFFQASGE